MTNTIRTTLQKVGLAAVAMFGFGCGPSASGHGVPPGRMEYDVGEFRIYRDGARVEYLPVPESIRGVPPESFAQCYYLNAAGVGQIERTVESLDPDMDYPERDCPNAPVDAYSHDLLHLEGFVYSPFVCPWYVCYCNPAIAPIASVFTIADLNLQGITPTDEDGNELWYLDTTRTCEPGEWRSPGG